MYGPGWPAVGLFIITFPTSSRAYVVSLKTLHVDFYVYCEEVTSGWYNPRGPASVALSSNSCLLIFFADNIWSRYFLRTFIGTQVLGWNSVWKSWTWDVEFNVWSVFNQNKCLFANSKNHWQSSRLYGCGVWGRKKCESSPSIMHLPCSTWSCESIVSRYSNTLAATSLNRGVWSTFSWNERTILLLNKWVSEHNRIVPRRWQWSMCHTVNEQLARSAENEYHSYYWTEWCDKVFASQSILFRSLMVVLLQWQNRWMLAWIPGE